MRNESARGQSVAQRGEIARAAAIEAEARQRAQEIRRRGEALAQGFAQRRRLDEEGQRVEPLVDLAGVGERARQALGEQARAGGRRGHVDRGDERARALARERAGEFEIGARRGVDFEPGAARAPRRRREPRRRVDLGALDVAQRQGRGGDFRAAELTEALQRLDAVELSDPLLRARAVAGIAPQRRRGNPGLRDQPGKAGIVEQGLRRDDLARLQARDFEPEARFVGLAQIERAGRDVERGQAEGRAPFARPDALDREKNIGAAGLQQPFLGDRAGRDEAHHVALDDGFAAALLGFRGVFELLADGDAMAERDEALQIIVGALDRHAAHADVLALVLAALGQHDAERAAGDFRVREEQFVEIAHAIEQQAIGIGGLDLEILRHHRRQARRLGRARRIRRAFDGLVHAPDPSKSDRRAHGPARAGLLRTR